MKLTLFILRRFGRLALTLFLISTIIFFVIRVIPGDPALIVAGLDASPEALDAIRARLGTDQPADGPVPAVAVEAGRASTSAPRSSPGSRCRG